MYDVGSVIQTYREDGGEVEAEIVLRNGWYFVLFVGDTLRNAQFSEYASAARHAEAELAAVKVRKSAGTFAGEKARPDGAPSPAELLEQAAAAIRERAQLRDTPEGERSMRRAVNAFNALSGRTLSEHDGWLFMVVLKAARATAGRFHMDDYTDMAGYAALAAECAANEKDFPF